MEDAAFPGTIVLPALLQKLVGEFFILGREFWREFFAGFFWDPQIKAQKIGENFGAFFARNFAPRNKSLVPTSFCRRATLNNCLTTMRPELITQITLAGGRLQNLVMKFFPDFSPVLLCRAVEIWSWSFCLKFFCSDCPNKTSPKTLSKTSAQTLAKTSHWRSLD